MSKKHPLIYLLLLIAGLLLFPFTIGFLIVRYLIKTPRIKNKNLRIVLISVTVILSLVFGSVWVVAWNTASTKRELTQNIRPTVIPTATIQPTPTPTVTIQPSEGPTRPVNEPTTHPTETQPTEVQQTEQVYSEYGVLYPQTAGTFAVDHFIPLELGGSNNIKNLWLEPANPRPGYHEKDQVCSGSMALDEAQNEIQTDWYAVYLRMGQIGNTGTINQSNTENTNSGATSTGSSGNTGTSTSTATTDHPQGATGRCIDGTFTYSVNHQGACSHHQGVAQWF